MSGEQRLSPSQAPRRWARPSWRAARWPVVTLALMFASFAVGRLTGRFQSLPSMVATLPGDESEFSQEFDERIRQRFPIGASEDGLLAYLAAENFTPEWRRHDEPNASVFIWNGLLCKKFIRVAWRADANGALSEIGGTYQSQCL